MALRRAPLQAIHGYVSIAFAEEKWAEQEAALATSMAQLWALLRNSAETAAPEVANEVGDATVWDLEDDEAWSRVGKARRKAVLHRERNVLARHVRASLSKVPMAHSPCKQASG